VEDCEKDVAVKYITPFSSTSTIQKFVTRSLKSALKPEPANCITLEISTPLFYALFARHPSPLQFFESTFSTPANQHQTVHVSHPDLFLTLFTSWTPSPSSQPLSRLSWFLISWLRSFSTTSKHAKEIPSLPRLSQLDTFVQQHLSAPLTHQYRTTMLKLLLSDIVFHGNPTLIDGLIIILRLIFCYLYAGALWSMLEIFRAEGLTGISSLGKGVQRGPSSGEYYWWWWMPAPRLVGLHAWWAMGQSL
jgi:hypothetical protein